MATGFLKVWPLQVDVDLAAMDADYDDYVPDFSVLDPYVWSGSSNPDLPDVSQCFNYPSDGGNVITGSGGSVGAADGHVVFVVVLKWSALPDYEPPTVITPWNGGDNYQSVALTGFPPGS